MVNDQMPKVAWRVIWETPFSLSGQVEKISYAAGYQSIYADRKGIYEGVSGVRKLKGVIIKEEVPLGYEISIPHSEMVMNVMASAPTPEGVDRLLNDALRDAKVIVGGKQCGVPLSWFVG